MARLWVVSGLLLSSLLWGATPESESRWEWFSDKPRDLKPLFADPREAQARFGYLNTGNGKSYLDIGLGGQMGFLRITDEDSTFSFAPRAHITGRFQYASRSFDLQNNDFIGGFAGTYRRGPHALEALLFHQSSHLGDDLVSAGQAPANFSFEAARLLYAQDFLTTLRAYTGIEVKVRSDPKRLSGATAVIFGGDWHFVDAFPSVYTALDIRFRQENYFSPNTTFQIGHELGDAKTVSRRQRVFLEVFNGHSNMGQFDRRWEWYFMLGAGANL